MQYRALFGAASAALLSSCLFWNDPSCGDTFCPGEEVTVASSSSVAASSSGGPAPIGEVGEGGHDPGYLRADWSPCDLEVAVDPASTDPPVVWTPCASGVAGCEEAHVDHPAASADTLFTSTLLAASPTSLAILHQRSTFGVSTDEVRLALYDAVTGSPSAVFLSPDGACFIDARFTKSLLWLEVGAVDVAPVLAFGPPGEVALAPRVAVAPPNSGGLFANDERVFLGADASDSVPFYDRATNSARSAKVVGTEMFHHPGEDFDLAPVNATADYDDYSGQVWTPESGAYAKLIDAGDQVVPDIASDGTTLVWMQTPRKAPNTEGFFPLGDLYTSPMTTKPSEVVPKKRRHAHAVDGAAWSMANDGYYAAFVGTPDDGLTIHLYRLADMQHWALPLPASDEGFAGLAFVDSTYVYYPGQRSNYRQAIAELGPGDPAGEE